MKRILSLWPFIILLFLSGCSTSTPITSSNTGVWDHFFVYPISFVIAHISYLFHDNFGIGIIAITLLIRFALVPLAVYLQNNQMHMQRLQPEVQRLRETYSSKDAESQQQLNKEMMRLYQQNNMNPMMGCLPAIIQMCILMALYHAITRTQEISSHSFLWFSLGSPDPLHILPLLAAAATFLQYRMMYQQQSHVNIAAQQMKMMTYMMPVMILLMSFNLASAIGLYWVVGNTFMVVQTLFLQRWKRMHTPSIVTNEKA